MSATLHRSPVSVGLVDGLPRTRRPYRLSAALAAVAAIAGAATVLVPDVLSGPPAMRGSARGTALVVLVVAVPALFVGARLTARGSARGLLVWLGAAGYLLYNAVMLLFGTPFNRWFLLYAAMLSLSIWTVLALLADVDVDRLADRFDARLPARALAVYVWVVAGLNALVWLRRVVPAVLGSNPASVLEGTGLTTSPPTCRTWLSRCR